MLTAVSLWPKRVPGTKLVSDNTARMRRKAGRRTGMGHRALVVLALQPWEPEAACGASEETSLRLHQRQVRVSAVGTGTTIHSLLKDVSVQLLPSRGTQKATSRDTEGTRSGGGRKDHDQGCGLRGIQGDLTQAVSHCTGDKI